MMSDFSMKARLIRAEATSGLMLVGGLVAVAVAVVLGLTPGLGSVWGDRSAVTTVVTIFTASILLAVATIVSGRRVSQLGRVAAVSPVGRRHLAVVTGAAGVMWACVVFVIQAVVPVLAQLPTDRLTWPMVLPYVQILVSLCVAPIVGSFLGTVGGEFPLGPVIAFVLFGWFYGSNYLPGHLVMLAPFEIVNFVPWIEPEPLVHIGHSAIALGFGLLAAGLVSSSRRTQLAAGLIAAALIAGGVVLALHPEERYRPKSAPEGLVCAPVGDDARFCYHPLIGEDGQEMAAALSAVDRVTSPHWATPTVMVPFATPDPPPGAVVIPFSTGADAYIDYARLALVPHCADTEQGWSAYNLLMEWVGHTLGSAWQPEGELAEVMSWSEEEQSRWVDRKLADGQCS